MMPTRISFVPITYYKVLSVWMPMSTYPQPMIRHTQAIWAIYRVQERGRRCSQHHSIVCVFCWTAKITRILPWKAHRSHWKTEPSHRDGTLRSNRANRMRDPDGHSLGNVSTRRGRSPGRNRWGPEGELPFGKNPWKSRWPFSSAHPISAEYPNFNFSTIFCRPPQSREGYCTLELRSRQAWEGSTKV